jgi:uncharacterized protein (DUF1501 family)
LTRTTAGGTGWSRRDFVRVGGLTALGLGLVDLLRGRADGRRLAHQAMAKSCILIWLDGGPSHLETFDPKPDAPAEIRGPIGAISTALPGVALSELMPQVASRLNRCTLIRSVTSPLGEHNFGTHYLLTGFRPTPALHYPAVGSVVNHLQRSTDELPGHIAIPDLRVGGARFVAEGYLPRSAAPFEVGGDPSQPGFRVRSLDPFPGITSARLARRRDYLRELDRHVRLVEQTDEPVLDADPAFVQAYRLMSSAGARAAFNLAEEPAAVRDRYGSRSVGQSCLLARRLVERGVPFVTVNNTGWDTHQDLYTRLKEGYTGARIPVGLVPSLDQALGALIDDLDQQGRLDETLIVVMGEFGRTPKLNPQGGRDHWPRVFSVLLAGGGVPGGQVIGQSDAMGESPQERPITPADWAATWYTLLGIDPRATLMTADGRPVPLTQAGQVIQEIVG